VHRWLGLHELLGELALISRGVLLLVLLLLLHWLRHHWVQQVSLNISRSLRRIGSSQWLRRLRLVVGEVDRLAGHTAGTRRLIGSWVCTRRRRLLDLRRGDLDTLANLRIGVLVLLRVRHPNLTLITPP
jgi:hypothetical protein